MRLEDYKPQPQRYGWKELPEKYSFIHEIKSYKNISRDKAELFESIPKYIKYYYHCSDLDYEIDEKTSYIQSNNEKGNRVLVEIPIVESYIEHGEAMDDVVRVTREEYERRKNKYKHVGSQFYRTAYINAILGTIIITGDGHVFAEKETINKIAETDINEIAKELHEIYIEHKRGYNVETGEERIYWLNCRLRIERRGKYRYNDGFEGYTIKDLIKIFGPNGPKRFIEEMPVYEEPKKKTKKKSFWDLF